ncbi:MAG TPA: enoyl-CoA hydratase-related protein [Nitrososphaeraceae archaeon]|jgi:3-hydroxypropionyl-coenzyme A dehydratase
MKFIELEKMGENDCIAVLRINRPEVLNAINIDVIADLSTMFDALGADDNTRVVIITGTGERSFCAGADLRYVVDKSPIEAERYASTIHALLNKIENLSKPVIAAINGYALGGGCEIALACDIRIASSNAKIGQTEVKVGIPPGWGGTQRMLRLLRVSKAKELIYTGRMITAAEAYQIGLVNKVVYPDEKGIQGTESFEKNNAKNNSKPAELDKVPVKSHNKLMAECIEFANTILKNSQFAVTVSKMLINKALDVDINAGLNLEIYGWSLCFAHEDRVKMMSAFLNKKIK